MTSPYMHATLKCGDPAKLRDEDLPNLPSWFPLPPRDDDGREIVQSDEQRAALRRARAVVEAVTGPLDGRREQVRVDAAGRPPSQIVLVDGTCIYTLSVVESNKHHAVYRYSPQLSLMHKRVMRGIEDGFTEYGRDYALEASHDDTDAIGYSNR